MRLVADDQVVAAVRCAELLLHVLVARQLIQARDGEVVFQGPVARSGGFKLFVGQDLEGEMEEPTKLVLPLLGQAAGTDDEAAIQVAAREQLLDKETGHDGLARAGIVGKQEAQRLPWQHGFVDRSDLVRQRLDQRCVNGQHRIEEVGGTYVIRLGDEPEERAIAVEAPRSARPSISRRGSSCR